MSDHSAETTIQVALWTCAAFVQAASGPVSDPSIRESLLAHALSEANKAFRAQAERAPRRDAEGAA